MQEGAGERLGGVDRQLGCLSCQWPGYTSSPPGGEGPSLAAGLAVAHLQHLGAASGGEMDGQPQVARLLMNKNT